MDPPINLLLWEEEFSNEELADVLEEIAAGGLSEEPFVAAPAPLLHAAARGIDVSDQMSGLDLALFDEDFSSFGFMERISEEEVRPGHQQQQPPPLSFQQQQQQQQPFVPTTTHTNSSTNTAEAEHLPRGEAPATHGGSAFSQEQQSLLRSLSQSMFTSNTLLGAGMPDMPSTSLESNTSRGSAGATRHQRRSVTASPSVVPSTIRAPHHLASLSVSLEGDEDDQASASARSLQPVIPCTMCEKTFPCNSKVGPP